MPAILILTETWLNYTISNHELNLSNYLVYRSDRKLDEKGEIVQGGGVLIAIARYIKSSSLKVTHVTDTIIDELYVKVTHGNGLKYIFGVVYFPPAATIKDYQIHIDNAEYINNSFEDYKFIMCGDFNLPKISWLCQDHSQYFAHDTCNSQDSECALVLCNYYSTLNLEQVHPNHTAKNYSLDLVFAEQNLMNFNHSSDQLVPIDKQHHESATFMLKTNISTCSEIPYTHTATYNFRKLDNEALITCLECIDWTEILNFNVLDFNGTVQIFYDLLYAAIDLSVPKIGKVSKKFPPWYTPALKKSILD